MASRRKTVQLRLTAELLAQLLRLDESMRIENASQDGDILTLTVRAPNAPNGAFEMVPHYYHNGRPDPVTLTEVEWHLPEGRTAITPRERPRTRRPRVTATVDLLVTTEQLLATFPWLTDEWHFPNGRRSILITVERDGDAPTTEPEEVAA